MIPRWELSDFLVEILLKHPSLQIAAVVTPILILLGAVVTSCWPRLFALRKLAKKIRAALPKVLHCLQLLLLGLLTSAGSVAVILLIGVALNACGSRCSDTLDTLAINCTRPLGQALSVVGIVVGGLVSAFGERASLRMIGGAVLGVGMVIAAPNFLSFYAN